jgi:hypothetical protein
MRQIRNRVQITVFCTETAKTSTQLGACLYSFGGKKDNFVRFTELSQSAVLTETRFATRKQPSAW